jgi:diguanylate cyclase (GGDEF)-like protein/PAS domain S-box-containing protein
MSGVMTTKTKHVKSAVRIKTADTDEVAWPEVAVTSSLDDTIYRKLFDNEKLFADTMLDSMPGILYFYDTDGRFLRWNRNFESVSGYTGKEIARMHPLDFFSDAEKKLLRERIAEVFERGESSVEASLLCKDGTAKPHFFTGRRVVLNGKPCLVGVGIDISQRKQMEHALVESERKYRELVELANSIILYWRSDGTVIFLNEFGQRFFGYSAEEIVGKHVVGTLVPHNESGGRDLQQLMQCICADPKSFEQNINENLRRNGERVWIAWTNKLISHEESGNIEILSVGTDITQRLETEREIKFMNSMLQTQQETSLDAILVVDENHKVISYNQQFIDLWKLSPQMVRMGQEMPLLEKAIEQIEDADAFIARIQYLYEHRDTRDREELQFRDGRIIDRYSAPITGEDGKYYGRVWYFRDITERKTSEARILGLNRVYAVLSGINALIVRVHDRDELFREACRITVEAGAFKMAWIGLLDSEADLIRPVASAGNVGDFFEVAPAEVFDTGEGSIGRAGQAIRTMQPVVSNDFSNGKQKLMRKGLEDRGIHSFAMIPLIVGGKAIGVFALYSDTPGYFDEKEMRLLTSLAGDISFAIDHIEKQDRLDYLAFYDELTGLANRSLFLERVAQYLRSARNGKNKLAVVLVDLMRFKNINDSLGWTVGDTLLKQIADWLTLSVGDTGLLARLEADRFALVLPHEKLGNDAQALLENLAAGFLDRPLRLNDDVFRISARLGVALYADHGNDAETLLSNAEAALREAKARGERLLFYTQQMTETVVVKLTLENQLRQALENEEFVLHYQPKIDLGSGKLTSAEALIRWNDPTTGLVPPGRFIPILEETGLIHDVGRWALRQAVKDYLRWHAAGLPAVPIAVNVSPLQLRKGDFIAEIEQVIGMDACAAGALELEITESVIMEDIKHSIELLKTLRGMGISIAIDDFGTGFSSLGYLAKLPADTLKIDRSFIIEMTNGPEGLALVSTIINLAHSLKLKVVAEGVDTEEQASLLRLLNCEEMQGYLFSKPVCADTFESKFLSARITS